MGSNERSGITFPAEAEHVSGLNFYVNFEVEHVILLLYVDHDAQGKESSIRLYALFFELKLYSCIHMVFF